MNKSVSLISVVAVVAMASPGLAADTRNDAIAFFEKRIRPLLAEHCYRCHSTKAKRPRAGLFLDSREGMLKGGDSGPAIVPGHPEKSLLIKAVYYGRELQMPPKGKLPSDKIEALRKWVQMGAPWPEGRQNQQIASGKSIDWEKARQSHWAFRPVRRPELPKVKNTAWPKNPIDFFILARLEAKQMRPAPPADRRTLIRRAYLDLIGLPPSPEDVQAFVNDRSPDAFSKLVDRLLASPHYGERWGRYWLDVARYSDGFGGFLDNNPLPNAWKYRDWVVKAFNADMPYNVFLKLQIAGDLTKDPEGAVATGFFAVGPSYRSDGGDPDSVAQAKSETLDDRIDTLGRGVLGLTIGCARCHDHKFDPIPTLDYYSLAGVFNNTRTIQDRKAPLHRLAEAGSGDMRVAIRGNLRKPGAVAPRRFLRILSNGEPKRFTKGSGRLELAEAVVAPSNPLTARVMVNRIWLHHFGKGLVRTPSNFGKLGEEPTHPELLDWLADFFVRSGWSIKALHRLIMQSSAYQMSSRFDERNFALDGDNRLIWRMNLRKLDVEAWRDSLLAVTGELDRKLGGPPTDNVHSRRRTLYFKVSRNGDRFATDAFLRLFDFPLMRATVAKRPSSIVPQQFLFLMNSRFMMDRARALAERLEALPGDDGKRIEHAYELLFARPPTAEEIELGLAFLHEQPPQATAAKPEPSKDQDILIADFEGSDYQGWKATGEAFGPGPAQGTLPGQMAVSGYLGHGLVNSFYRGDRTTGTLTSPPFKIQRRYIHFLVGGGKFPGRTCINLIVDGKVVHTATGPNDRPGGSERLAWKTWDVGRFKNRQAIIQIVDAHTGGWGHINVDHIFQSDKTLDPRRVPTASHRPGTGLSRWQEYAQVLLSSNEFMYVR